MSPIPLLRKCRVRLAAGIADGTMPEILTPPEEGLIERFKVSRTTVRKHPVNLIERGLRRSETRKKFRHPAGRSRRSLIELTGFVSCRRLGEAPPPACRQAHRSSQIKLVARQLALAPGHQLSRLRRVRLADGGHVVRRNLLAWIGEKVADNDLEAEPGSRCWRRSTIRLVEAEYKLEAAAADLVAAEALLAPTGSPIFLIERTSYTTGNGLSIERLHYRGDLIRSTRLLRRATTQHKPAIPDVAAGQSRSSWARRRERAGRMLGMASGIFIVPDPTGSAVWTLARPSAQASSL